MAKKSKDRNLPNGAHLSANPHQDLLIARKALQESEEKYRAIIENIEDGYYEVDLAGNFTAFNNAIAQMIGYTAKELKGLNNRVFMDEYNAKRVFQVFNNVYLTGLPSKAFDWELIHKNGSRRTIEVSISLRKDLSGKPVGFMGIARDITQRKLIEKALRESEEKYRTIIENIEDGYYEVDLAGNFTFFNEAMARMIGYSNQELMGMNNRQIMDEFNAKRVYRVFNSVYLTGLAAKAFDWELIHKDGSKKIIEVSVSLRKDLAGKPVGFMGIARDVTQRKEYQLKLEMREKELEEKTHRLQDTNTALRVLLDRREADKSELENTFMTNIQNMIMPYLSRVTERAKDKKQLEYLDVLKNNLESVTTTFTYKLTQHHMNLTSSEIEVANLVRNGKSTKEIADLLNVSIKTVEVHRSNIRKKLGISNRKAGLRTHLLSIR